MFIFNFNMNVHLVRSKEYQPEKFWEVVDLLNKHPGLLQFIHREQAVVIDDELIERVPFDYGKFKKQKASFPSDFSPPPARNAFSFPEKQEVVKWKDLFETCKIYRKKHVIGDDDFVVLLTEFSNEQNWFASGDPKGSRNIFVHTAYWDYFTGSDQRYPVAYHVVTIVLKHLLFLDFSELNSHWHEKAKGCMMDFCRNKQDISLKLRTGDICPSCLRLIEQRELDAMLVSQVFGVMEDIRSQMIFKDRYVIHRKPPELEIGGRLKKFRIPMLGDLEIKLTPLEKTVYLLFLAHPEGLSLPEVHDHKEEFNRIYRSLSNADDRGVMDDRINDLTDVRSNSLSEKISRIKRKFTDALGEDMAIPFLITGDRSGKRVIPAGVEGLVRVGE